MGLFHRASLTGSCLAAFWTSSGRTWAYLSYFTTPSGRHLPVTILWVNLKRLHIPPLTLNNYSADALRWPAFIAWRSKFPFRPAVLSLRACSYSSSPRSCGSLLFFFFDPFCRGIFLGSWQHRRSSFGAFCAESRGLDSICLPRIERDQHARVIEVAFNSLLLAVITDISTLY